MNTGRNLEPSPDEVDPWVKSYRGLDQAAQAAANYRWLERLSPPLRLPRLTDITGSALHFQRLNGRHVVASDLARVAAHLGDVHAVAHQRYLHRARLDHGLVTQHPSGRRHQIPSFLTGRVEAVVRLLDAQVVPHPLLDGQSTVRVMIAAVGQPACFYKDTNPRNLIVTDGQDVGTADAPVTIDFDDLTLAPFGYDLAKLVVTVAMTTGQIPDGDVSRVLEIYNAALHSRNAGLPGVTMRDFVVWAEIHHILTCRYIGRHGYRHGWHQLRPTSLLPAAYEVLKAATARTPAERTAR